MAHVHGSFQRRSRPGGAAGRGVRGAAPPRASARRRPSTPSATRSGPTGSMRCSRRCLLMEQHKPGVGDRSDSAEDGGGRGRAAGAAGGLPDHPRGRPRRHGRRLRGRAGVAGPPRGPEGPAAAQPARPEADGPVPARGPRGGPAAPHQHRPGLRRRRARRRPLLRHAVHPGPGARRGPARGATPAAAGPDCPAAGGRPPAAAAATAPSPPRPPTWPGSS